MTTPESHDRGSLQRRAIQGAAWTGFHTIVALPIAFGVNLLLARILGVADYGRLAYLTAVIGVAGSIAALGVGSAILQFGSKAHSAGRANEVQSLLRAGSGWRLLVSAPIVTIIVLILVRLDPLLLILAIIFGIWLPSALGGLGIAVTLEQKTAQGAKAALLGSVITQTAVVGSLLAFGTPDGVWASRLVVGTLTVAILLPIVSRAYRTAVLAPSNPFRLPRKFWKFAIPTGLAATLGGLVTSRSEVILLEWLSTPQAVGLFSLAFGLAAHVYAPAQSFVGPLVPAVSGLAEIDPPAVRRAFTRVLRCAAVVAGIFAAGALPGFAALIPLLYGPEFAAAADMMMALGAVASLGLISGPMTAFLHARLRGRRVLTIETISFVLNVASAVILIPLWNAWGAVAAAACAIVVRLSILLHGEAQYLGVKATEVFRSIASLMVSITVSFTVWILMPRVGPHPLVAAVVLGTTGTILAIVLIRMLRIGIRADDRDAISRVAPTRVRRPVTWVLNLVVTGGEGSTLPRDTSK